MDVHSHPDLLLFSVLHSSRLGHFKSPSLIIVSSLYLFLQIRRNVYPSVSFWTANEPRTLTDSNTNNYTDDGWWIFLTEMIFAFVVQSFAPCHVMVWDVSCYIHMGACNSSPTAESPGLYFSVSFADISPSL